MNELETTISILSTPGTSTWLRRLGVKWSFEFSGPPPLNSSWVDEGWVPTSIRIRHAHFWKGTKPLTFADVRELALACH